MKKNSALFAFLLAFILLWSGCGSEPMAPAQRLQSGEYVIDILTPGGVFKNGSNAVVIEVKHGGEHALPIRSGGLQFVMPAMGTMPTMKAPATLRPDAATGQLAGTVTFSMAGGWNAQLEVEIEEGPLRGTFSVQVE